MALWSNYEESSDDLYTTVYLLRDILQSALDDAAGLVPGICRKPALMPGAGHAEIAARLSRFRVSFNELRGREAMMLTKLLRARDWAGELRRAAPQIRDDADQFIDATSVCEELQAEFVSDPQRLFNGGELPLRFMERRGSAGSGPSQDYRVGGRVDLLELRVACEVFLAQIDQHFFSDDLPNETRRASSILAYLDLAEEQIAPPEDEAPPPAVH